MFVGSFDFLISDYDLHGGVDHRIAFISYPPDLSRGLVSRVTNSIGRAGGPLHSAAGPGGVRVEPAAGITHRRCCISCPKPRAIGLVSRDVNVSRRFWMAMRQASNRRPRAPHRTTHLCFFSACMLGRQVNGRYETDQSNTATPVEIVLVRPAMAPQLYRLGKSLSIAATTLLSRGLVSGGHRPAKSPAPSIKYLWKFHFGAAPSPSSVATQR